MNTVDKRTGETFPSVLRHRAIEALRPFYDDEAPRRPAEPASRAYEALSQAEYHDLADSSDDWLLNLDPSSLTQYGVFADSRILFGTREAGDDPEEVQERPVEWFRRVAEETRTLLYDSGELWDVLNEIFDRAAEVADAELGFTPTHHLEGNQP